jgi:hypothetical protein
MRPSVNLILEQVWHDFNVRYDQIWYWHASNDE